MLHWFNSDSSKLCSTCMWNACGTMHPASPCPLLLRWPHGTLWIGKICQMWEERLQALWNNKYVSFIWVSWKGSERKLIMYATNNILSYNEHDTFVRSLFWITLWDYFVVWNCLFLDREKHWETSRRIYPSQQLAHWTEYCIRWVLVCHAKN